MLTFPNEWRFEAPGDPLPSIVINQFDDLISRVASQGDRWNVIEFFKARFAGAAGLPSHTSSSLSWAEGDLANIMQGAAENAPLFIDAFCKACVELREQEPNWGFPTIGQLNRVLSEAETGYAIQPPNLVFTGMQVPIIKPERQPSLDEQAQQLIQRSLDQSEQLLREGRGRQAVSEILWLLETVSTAFRGLDAGSAWLRKPSAGAVRHVPEPGSARAARLLGYGARGRRGPSFHGLAGPSTLGQSHHAAQGLVSGRQTASGAKRARERLSCLCLLYGKLFISTHVRHVGEYRLSASYSLGRQAVQGEAENLLSDRVLKK